MNKKPKKIVISLTDEEFYSLFDQYQLITINEEGSYIPYIHNYNLPKLMKTVTWMWEDDNFDLSFDTIGVKVNKKEKLENELQKLEKSLNNN